MPYLYGTRMVAASPKGVHSAFTAALRIATRVTAGKHSSVTRIGRVDLSAFRSVIPDATGCLTCPDSYVLSMSEDDQLFRTPSHDDHAAEEWVEITRSHDDDVARANVRDLFELELDEAEWIAGGTDAAPWPSNYLLVATAGCQVEAMQQAMTTSRIDDYEITVRARPRQEDLADDVPGYPDHMSWRYTDIEMEIEVETSEENLERVERLVDLAEDACIVSRSVERGINFTTSKRLRSRE